MAPVAAAAGASGVVELGLALAAGALFCILRRREAIDSGNLNIVMSNEGNRRAAGE